MATDPRVRATRPEIWFNAVSSACPAPGCGQRINGKHHITVEGHVVMRQFCPEHGHRAALISTDVDWFAHFEQLAAMLPPRENRAVPAGTCCVPEVVLEADAAAERARRLLWLRDASPGGVHFVSRDPAHVDAPALTAALAQAQQAGHACVSVALPAARLLEHDVAAALEAAGAIAHVAADDPGLAELLERRPALRIVMVTQLDRPVAEQAEALAASFRRFRDAPAIGTWEIVPAGTVSAAWHQHDHHPSKGPDGLPSNGPVPRPGPVPATVSEALPSVAAASGGLLARDDFFPMMRFHPPGSALAVLRRTAAGELEPVNAALSPRGAIDLIAGQSKADTTDAGVLAVRALFGASGRLHPDRTNALVTQALGEGGPAKAVIVHSPLGRDAYDRTRHLRACPLPRENREECNDACVYRAR